MFQGLSENSKRIINNLAPIEMEKLSHKVVQPEHILIALLKDAGEEVFTMLDEIVDMVHFQCILESHMDKISDEEAISSKNILVYYNIDITPEISQRTKNVILSAIDESRNYNQDILDTFSLFVSCCADKQSIANVILMRHQLALDDFRKHYIKFLKEKESALEKRHATEDQNKDEKGQSDTSTQEFTLSLRKNMQKKDMKDQHINAIDNTQRTIRQSSELQKYSINLTKKYHDNKIHKIYGRNDEIEKIFRILLRKQKNNPLLIGDAGVGKTAIVEELARRIAIGDAPLPLLESQIVELNLTSLTAGTKYRGDFEERLLNIINEVIHISKERKIFLFIDEFHHIVGTGLATGLTMDAAGILKPALARGVLSCIGATTFEEYRKHIEMDKAFQRRLQLVEIEEMNADSTVLALQQVKKEYEVKHNVRYSNDAIKEIVHLSSNYFFDRKLPDKAIDLLDEIGSYTTLQKIQTPQELKHLMKEENLLLHSIRRSVQKEKKDEVNDSEVGKTDKNIDNFHAISKKRKDLQNSLIKTIQKKQARITPKVVRDVISKITGINQESLHSKNIKLLANFETKLTQKVIGQDKAISAIVSSVSRGILGLRPSKQPMGSFIFLGPSGVGKTYTAKQLAIQLYGTDDAITRFDMSDYSESNSISRLIGSPPGYVGFEDSGILIKNVRQRPRQVLLFDEIEKAHPRIYDIFLQILEEGHLQGQRGEYADFRHSIIIFTSNIGSSEILKTQSVGFSTQSLDDTGMETVVRKELKKVFRLELLNRFNDIIVFNTLKTVQIQKIIHNMLEIFCSDLRWNKIYLTVEEKAKDLLIDKFYHQEYGARSILRGLHVVEDCIAESLLKGEVKEGDTIILSERQSRFFIAKQKNRHTKKATVLLSKKSNNYKKEKNLISN